MADDSEPSLLGQSAVTLHIPTPNMSGVVLGSSMVSAWGSGTSGTVSGSPKFTSTHVVYASGPGELPLS
jgi:hypothetical protein